MTRALFAKELRETAGIAALALAAYVYVVTSMAGIQVPPVTLGVEGIPFVGGEFALAFTLVSAAMVLAMGLRQSLGESYRGTFLLLFHCPASRWRLIAAKLLVGSGLSLAIGAMPIAVYAWWAATPGTHASPFEWSMTAAAWKLWISMVPVYLASFLTGIRPAHWIGTRLAPLAAVGLVVGLLQWVPWWPLFAAALVVLGAALLAAIFFVAEERDY